MHKVYLLLRNNKKTGPYSIQDLEALSLQTHDLIWIEGKSAGWQYPAEVNELKSLVEGIKEQTTILSTASALSSTTCTEIRKTSGKVYVSLPSLFKKENISVSSKDPDERKDAFEKKAEELFKRSQSYLQKDTIAEDQNETETEIKYCKSLNELKSEYASWIQQQKNKDKTWKNKNLIVAAAILMVACSFAIYAFDPAEENHLALEKNTVKETQFRASPVFEEEQSSLIKKTEPSATSGKKYIPAKTSRKKVPVAKRGSATKKSKEIKSNPVINKEPENHYKSLPDLVKINGSYKPIGNGVAKPEITVRNNSPEALRVVAVNVVYYHADGSLAGKEILYFNDLSPEESMTLRAPANLKAEEVRFKLGLISSKEGEIYYALQ